MSPRSGTPVKLLGREDASVDWYNLEKSKRVKAFRCGEFDACIERAEASQGIPIKKREKYARREDAILHALELEKEQLEMKHQKLGIASNGISNKASGAYKRDLSDFSSDIYMRNDEEEVHSKFASHKPQIFSRKAALYHEEENMDNSLYVHKGKLGKQSVWEEDNPESIPRMRGLQDFGLRIAPSKRKLSQSVSWETSRNPIDNHVDILPSAGLMEGANLATSSKNSLVVKRKRSQGGMIEESLVKKRDRRRPLVQVLQSSAKLPVSHSFQSDNDSGIISMQGDKDHMGIISQAKRSRCVYLPADSNDSLDHSGYPCEQMSVTTTQFGMGNYLGHPDPLAEEEYTSSGLVEENESDSSETDYLEPDMEEEGNLLTDTTQIPVPGSKDCDPTFQVPEDFGNLNNNEMPCHGYMPQLHSHEQATDASAKVGVSKWHLKGKRNIRNLAKKPMDLMDGKVSFSSADKCNSSVKGTSYESRGSTFRTRSQRTLGRGIYHKKEESHYGLDGGDLIDKDLGHNQLMGYGNRRYRFPLHEAKDRGKNCSSFNDSDNDSHVITSSGWEADGPSSHAARRAYWEESDQCFDPVYDGDLGDEMKALLVDVNLKVQASYQGEHVPLVSLMSRLNGKAIIGHPVQIEIMEDGSTGHLVSNYDVGLEESSAPPSVWRTARRTAKQRVPRSNPAASALEAEDAEPIQYSDLEGKPTLEKTYSGYSNHQARLAKRSISHARRTSASGKFQKKLLKRVSLSSQKTRTLSSLATERKFSGENGDVKLSRGSDILGGLIKPEGGVPLVTCVPGKVVFSRIMEAVGRCSSAAAHRVRMASPAIRGP